MELSTTIEFIKLYFKNRGINLIFLYLFGSRANGKHRIDSDYDFLLVCESLPKKSDKRNLISGLRRFLLDNNAYLYMDLIIKTKEEWEWESNNFGFLSYKIKQEGKLL